MSEEIDHVNNGSDNPKSRKRIRKIARIGKRNRSVAKSTGDVVVASESTVAAAESGRAESNPIDGGENRSVDGSDGIIAGTNPGGDGDNGDRDRAGAGKIGGSDNRVCIRCINGGAGRHPNHCPRKRNKQDGQIPTEIHSRIIPPKVISLDGLQNSDQLIGLLPAQFDAALMMLWQTLYQVPVLMGYGVYWALNDVEAKSLTESTQNVLKVIPQKQRKKVMDALNKWLPITSFATTIAIITYPRVVMTQAIMNGRIHAEPKSADSDSRNNGQKPGSSGDQKEVAVAVAEYAPAFAGLTIT